MRNQWQGKIDPNIMSEFWRIGYYMFIISAILIVIGFVLYYLFEYLEIGHLIIFVVLLVCLIFGITTITKKSYDICIRLIVKDEQVEYWLKEAHLVSFIEKLLSKNKIKYEKSKDRKVFMMFKLPQNLSVKIKHEKFRPGSLNDRTLCNLIEIGIYGIDLNNENRAKQIQSILDEIDIKNQIEPEYENEY